MSGGLLILAPAPALDASGRTLLRLAAACAAGALALLSPSLALLALAALAARALLAGANLRLDLAAIAGPLTFAAILGGVFGLAAGIGALFAWRLFVDTRWSIARARQLARREGQHHEAPGAALAHAWLTPIYGLTLVAYTAPHMIAGLPLDLPHTPFWAPIVAGGLALAGALDWGLRRLADWRLGALAPATAAHLLAHHTLFLLAFGLSLDVSAGVVALIAWRLAHAAPQASFTAVP